MGLVGLRSSSMQGGFKVPAMGVIDPSYRGFIYCTTTFNDVEILENIKQPRIKYYEDMLDIELERYSRIHQLLVVPFYKAIELVESFEDLSTTDRGTSGHGEHTGSNLKL